MNNPRDIATTAAVRIAGCVRHTLLLNVAGAEPGSSFPVTLALELLQLAGSFKPRGPTTVRCRPACPPPAATPRSSPLSRYRRRKLAASLANPGPGALEVHARDHPDLLAGQETAGRNLQHDAPVLTHIVAGRAKVVRVQSECCSTLHNAALKSDPPVAAPVRDWQRTDVRPGEIP